MTEGAVRRPGAGLPVAAAHADKGPLSGMRVVDLSRVMAGNMLTLQFADLGADVIKVESPGEGDPLRHWKTQGIPTWWRTYCRNKRSIALNLRAAAGMEALRRLLVDADVLVENYRPGTLEAMGLAPETLLALNPRLVIARISGWGHDGPYRHKPGFGTLVEAYSGLAAKTGFADRPPVLPNMTLADMIAGLFGFGAVLAACRAADAPGGSGQVVEISLFDAMLACLGADPADTHLTGTAAPRTGSRSQTASPRNVYRTGDGEWVALSATTQGMAERLFRSIGRADLLQDERFATNAARVANADAVDAVIQEFVGRLPRAEVLRHFEAHEVTMGPVMDVGQVLDDPYVHARASLVAMADPDAGSLPMHNVVPRFSRTPGSLRRTAPALGEDTLDILQELGYGRMDALGLCAEGAAACTTS
jgi:crotonobetainyl-CoA:carnitine CoA-transferase CaiB-like acyl-CoA transferase